MHIPAGRLASWSQQSLWGSTGFKGQWQCRGRKPPSGLHCAMWGRSGPQFLGSRDWPYLRYLERRNHEQSSVRIGHVDPMALVRMSKAGHQWPPLRLPYGCLTKAIRQASWLPNMLALNHQVEGRTFLKSNLNNLVILTQKTFLLTAHKIT